LIRIFTCGRSGKLFDAEAGVEGPDGERGAAFVPEQDEPTDADAVRVQELRPPAPQERALAIPAHLHAPDLAERAHDEGCGLARSVLLAAAGSGVEAIGKLVGDALRKQRSLGLVREVLHRRLASVRAQRRGRSAVLTSLWKEGGIITLSCLILDGAPG
jgi:hypothetical protein